MIMSSTCRNLLFDTLHVCCWINCIIWKFLSGIGSGDRGHVLSNCSQIITISSLPREIKLHGQSSRAKNLQQIHQFAILLPFFLLTLNFPKKKYLSDIEKIYPKIFVSCIELVILTYFTGKCSKQNLSSDLNLKITLVENKRGEGINRIQWISAWTVWIANFPRADRLDIALPSHLLPSPFPEDFLNSFLSLRTHSMRSHLTFPVPRSKLLLPRLA